MTGVQTCALPISLSLFDQFSLWASPAVTLTIPAAAVFVVNPLGDKPLGTTAAMTAIVTGTVVGSLLLGAVALIGQRSERPTMMMIGSILGTRTSWLPTVLNIVQCVGWAAIEVLVMTEVATALTSPGLRPWWAVVSGGLAISGIFDLEPVRLNYLSEKLKLTQHDVARLSPLSNIPARSAPLILACGASELPELQRQSRAYADARAQAQAPGRLVCLPLMNHFTILESLASADGALTQLIRELAPN